MFSGRGRVRDRGGISYRGRGSGGGGAVIRAMAGADAGDS